MVPTIPSLEKNLYSFLVSHFQLFAEEDTPVSLTVSQRKLLERWSRLSEEQQAVVFALIDKWKSRQKQHLLDVPLAVLLIHQNRTVEVLLRFVNIPSGPVQNQFRIGQRIVVDEPVLFRLLEAAVRKLVLYRGTVNGNHAAVGVPQFNTTGTHVKCTGK